MGGRGSSSGKASGGRTSGKGKGIGTVGTGIAITHENGKVTNYVVTNGGVKGS